MTRQHYVKGLGYFMDYLHLPHDAYDKLLEKDPKHIQMDICDFVTYLRKRGNASASVSVDVGSRQQVLCYERHNFELEKNKKFYG